MGLSVGALGQWAPRLATSCSMEKHRKLTVLLRGQAFRTAGWCVCRGQGQFGTDSTSNTSEQEQALDSCRRFVLLPLAERWKLDVIIDATCVAGMRAHLTSFATRRLGARIGTLHEVNAANQWRSLRRSLQPTDSEAALLILRIDMLWKSPPPWHRLREFSDRFAGMPSLPCSSFLLTNSYPLVFPLLPPSPQS